jgi:hypothetical protein
MFDTRSISTDSGDYPDYQIDPALLKELRDQILEQGNGKVTKSHLRLRQLALDVATILDKAERHGLPQDWPEGSRYIQLSDTVAITISRFLKAIALAND